MNVFFSFLSILQISERSQWTYLFDDENESEIIADLFFKRAVNISYKT